ncbi:THUMP-like domain-containing protein [Nakamurella sp.]|uniref:THUMP-like domain-containing protein n=1 Tax=Nakamurella sp. TaxID=1869182 RepID=UPI003B3B70D3
MAYRFALSDVRYLTAAAGAEALAATDGLPLTDATLLADLTRVRAVAGERAAAVVETVRLRRRAAGKLGPAAAAWLFTDEALQQATPGPVAAHRAARLAGVGVHDLTCSIGADLAALAAPGAAGGLVVGSDLDPVRVLMARHNLAQGMNGAERPPRVFVADALTRTTRGLLGYADPARREGGRRITSAATVPSVDELDAAHAGRPPVLRVPPGIDYDALARPGEVELVSLDGVAREAVLWPAELAGPARRATVLRSDGPGEALTSDDPDDVPVGPPGEYLIDPDPAVVRAHLVRHWAARHGLWLLDPHLAYLTGPAVPPGVRGFRILDHAPYRERTVAQWARRDGVGTLEIKQRGTPVVPDELRRRLRPALTGPTRQAATLVIARIGRRPDAFWCRAVEPAPVPPAPPAPPAGR